MHSYALVWVLMVSKIDKAPPSWSQKPENPDASKKGSTRGPTGLSWAMKPPSAPKLGSSGTTEIAVLPVASGNISPTSSPVNDGCFAKQST